jgi:short-subunit dehydrogenase
MTASKQVFDVKVFGTVSMTKSFSPLLIEAKGTIYNIGSMSTYFVCPMNGVYTGANSALEYINHQMRMELEPFGVSVVHVSPPLSNFKFIPLQFLVLGDLAKLKAEILLSQLLWTSQLTNKR